MWLDVGKEGGASFFLDVRGGKKNHREPKLLKIKLIKGAVSSINRADTEQTALPGAARGCGALSSPLPSAPVSQHLQPLSALCYQLLWILLGPQKFIQQP